MFGFLDRDIPWVWVWETRASYSTKAIPKGRVGYERKTPPVSSPFVGSRRRPMTSPAPAPQPATSDSARNRGACGANEAQGLRLRTAPFCGRCEGAQARERTHGRLTRRAAAAAAATERDAVALALPVAISTEWDRTGLLWWRRQRRRRSPLERWEQSREEMDNTQHTLSEL